MQDYERAFAWAEHAFPELFSYSTEKFEALSFYVRFYSVSNLYLGYNRDDGHVYLFMPPHRWPDDLTDVGPLADYLPLVQQAGY